MGTPRKETTAAAHGLSCQCPDLQNSLGPAKPEVPVQTRISALPCSFVRAPGHPTRRPCSPLHTVGCTMDAATAAGDASPLLTSLMSSTIVLNCWPGARNWSSGCGQWWPLVPCRCLLWTMGADIWACRGLPSVSGERTQVLCFVQWFVKRGSYLRVPWHGRKEAVGH